MSNEASLYSAVNHGLRYPIATNYEYICPGFEAPADWVDHHMFFGLDGQEIQSVGVLDDSMPYIYYTPSYGYSQSAYNQYNPFVAGAIMGVDGPIAGLPQYYMVPSVENSVSSPLYIPMAVQSRADVITNSKIDPFIRNDAFGNHADVCALKHNLSSKSPKYSQTPLRNASNQTNSSSRVLDGIKATAGSTKQPMTHRNVASRSFPILAPSQILQGGVAQTVENVPNGKALSNHSRLKVALPPGKGSNGVQPRNCSLASLPKLRPKSLYGRTLDNVNASNDALIEQNPGPKINRLKGESVVKAYVTKTGDSDLQGNNMIYADQYNKGDFPTDYIYAKFFVIKSYSEDDVHKSIKYNVWSSTPNGNRRLNAAYEDAQKIAAGDSRSCPIFLFFSVNASGQFCGVAEMIGPVDFEKDMEFWQKDMWSGSFAVKWHIIKDVPNLDLRQIMLENNENKPVTHSRDTQEIHHKEGMEMLKIFKNHISKRCLLDDFKFYENREKIREEEKARLIFKSYENPYLVPPHKLAPIFDPCDEDKKAVQRNESDLTEYVSSNVCSVDGKPNKVVELKIGSLTISLKE